MALTQHRRGLWTRRYQSAAQTIAVDVASETDLALAIDVHETQTISVAVAEETDIAHPLGSDKIIPVARAFELDEAHDVTLINHGPPRYCVHIDDFPLHVVSIDDFAMYAVGVDDWEC